MPSKILSQKSKAVMPHLLSECHFLAIPRGELEGCFYYEYAREIPDFAARVNNYRALTPTEAEHMRDGLSIFKRRIGIALARSAFPLPWQRLSHDERTRLSLDLPALVSSTHALTPMRIVEGNPFEVFPGREKWPLEMAASVGFGAVRYGSFSINLAAGRAAIVGSFRSWVNRQIRRMDSFDKALASHTPIQKPGETGWRARLNQLGALRWRFFARERGLRFEAAKADAQFGNAMRLYGDQSTFNRAVRDARAAFEEMFPETTPIHDTFGWKD